jgi:hypothetical protein
MEIGGKMHYLWSIMDLTGFFFLTRPKIFQNRLKISRPKQKNTSSDIK